MSTDIREPGPRPLRDVQAFRCHSCKDSGTVCECHNERPWGGLCCDGPPLSPDTSCLGEVLCEHGACHCGGAGMPCPACCSPIPGDGTHSIVKAFIPDWMRS